MAEIRGGQPIGIRERFRHLFDRFRPATKRAQPGEKAAGDEFLSLREFSVAYTNANTQKQTLPNAPRELLQRLARWWACESREAFTALANDGRVLWWEPSPWPDALWPRARDIWADANTLAVLAQRYLHPSAKFFAGFDAVSIQAELLALVDIVEKEDAEPAKVELRLTNLEKRAASARADFQLAAVTRSKFDYLLGMGVGFLVAGPASLIVLAQWVSDSADRLLLGAAASGVAGAFGALVSVLLRLANSNLGVDYRAGPGMARVLGLSRLGLGAILAVALYWAIIGEVAPIKVPSTPNGQFAVFIAVGFAAGFSERYAQELLSLRQRREEDLPRRGNVVPPRDPGRN